MKTTAGRPAESETHMTEILIDRLRPGAVLPVRANSDDAGADLHSIEDRVLMPGERQLFDTGLAVAIPEGFVGYIKPRSGLALKYGIDVLGGVIDSGYRGEIGVVLVNHGRLPVELPRQSRIAQLVIQPVVLASFRESIGLPDTVRGVGGFGSTGVN
jgi:dUTP pyrophosphatase